jgi:hypothetical protein
MALVLSGNREPSNAERPNCGGEQVFNRSRSSSSIDSQRKSKLCTTTGALIVICNMDANPSAFLNWLARCPVTYLFDWSSHPSRPLATSPACPNKLPEVVHESVVIRAIKLNCRSCATPSAVEQASHSMVEQIQKILKAQNHSRDESDSARVPSNARAMVPKAPTFRSCVVR